MIQQDCLELSRGYLDAFHLDELLLARVLADAPGLPDRAEMSYLLPIHHIIPPVLILTSDIACLEPPVF